MWWFFIRWEKSRVILNYLGKIYLSLRDESRGLKCLRRSCALKRTLDNVGLVCQYLSPQETLDLLVWLEIPFTQRKRFFYVFLISNRSKTNTKKTLHSRIQNFSSFELPCRKKLLKIIWINKNRWFISIYQAWSPPHTFF